MTLSHPIIPAKAGTHPRVPKSLAVGSEFKTCWIPAFAGTIGSGGVSA